MSKPSSSASERALPTNSVLCPPRDTRHTYDVHRVRVLPLVPQAAQETARGAVRRAESQEARRVRLDDAQLLRDGRAESARGRQPQEAHEHVAVDRCEQKRGAIDYAECDVLTRRA